MSRYLLTDEAKVDIENIRRYLTQEAGARVTRSVLAKIREAFVFLSHTPEAGHIREDFTDEAVKFCAVFSYLIVYDPKNRHVEILRVLHGHRNVASVLEDEPESYHPE